MFSVFCLENRSERVIKLTHGWLQRNVGHARILATCWDWIVWVDKINGRISHQRLGKLWISELSPQVFLLMTSPVALYVQWNYLLLYSIQATDFKDSFYYFWICYLFLLLIVILIIQYIVVYEICVCFILYSS